MNTLCRVIAWSKYALLLIQDDEKNYDKTKEKIKSRKNKLKNSEIMESLREEFGVAPEVLNLLIFVDGFCLLYAMVV